MSTAASAPATEGGVDADRHDPGHAGGVRPWPQGVTAEKKAALIAGISQLLLDVVHKPLDSTFVVIEEVELENSGWGGLPVPELRKRRSPGEIPHATTADTATCERGHYEYSKRLETPGSPGCRTPDHPGADGRRDHAGNGHRRQ
jgi:4-oxalocrotonate tautomerase